MKDKNRFVEKVSNKGERIWDAEITGIYNGKRNCFVDCAYFLNNEVKTDKHYCYYEINPCELMWMNRNNRFVSTVSEIEWFNHNFQVRLGYEVISFDKRRINYTNLAIAYNVLLMEKELDEISAIEEDKRNLITLIAFYESKKNMNCDLFEIIYNKLIRATDTFAPYLENLDDTEKTIRTVIST